VSEHAVEEAPSAIQPEAPARNAPTSTGKRHSLGPKRWTILLCAIAVTVGALAYLGVRRSQAGPAISGAGISRDPGNVPNATAKLMQLSPAPLHAAPDFTLQDQQGHTLSLSSFRGRSVVLEFMDPHCTDICPIVSKEFTDAYRDLGADAANTVFVAVNVNQYHEQVSDMVAYSREQGLDAIATWHFFTGPNPALEKVWRDYGIYVQAANPNSDIVHTSIVYFIDPRGRERFTASPTDDHTSNGTAFLPLSQQASWEGA
jgi:protein SCO1